MQHLIHFANLVNEEDAAVRLCHKTGLWLRHTAVCQTFLCALIDGVMHRTEQGVRHIARIPAQCRPIRLDKGSIRTKGRDGAFFCRLQHKARRRRLANARRAVEQKVLWIGRGEFCHE